TTPTPPLGEQREIFDEALVSKRDEKKISIFAESLPESEGVETIENADDVEIRDMALAYEVNFEESPSVSKEPVKKYVVPGTSGSIKGKVVDEEGNPLPGVSIIVKGTNKGSVTDIEGNFELSVASADKKLSVSFIGFMTEEISIADAKNQIITLQNDIRALSEVVVVGYGTSSSRSSEAASQKVDPKPVIGMHKYRQYIKENLKYPEAARQNKIEGNVTLQFNIDKNGKILEITVVKSANPILDEEAIRLVHEGPKWKPATLDGKLVNEVVKLKIPFKIK
ncbi:MAG: TonB family protein, partial [Bacteroidota bacterium]|nr:TonB family protein [Bacteroidota bacterium]